jgi:primosomal protein N'
MEASGLGSCSPCSMGRGARMDGKPVWLSADGFTQWAACLVCGRPVKPPRMIHQECDEDWAWLQARVLFGCHHCKAMFSVPPEPRPHCPNCGAVASVFRKLS